MSPVPQSGSLLEVPLPRLLLDLLRDTYGGALLLVRERTEKRILFQEGVPVFAESNLPSETLGLQLLDSGKIGREDYARVVQHLQERGGKEGAALLALGLLGPKDLFVALKEQVRRRILDCFGWPDGAFQLQQGKALPADAQAFRSDPLRLVQDGLERHWGPDRILGQLGATLGRYPTPGRRCERIRRRLREDETLDAFLASLDGKTTLGMALQKAGSPAVVAACWILDASRAFDYAEAPVGAPEKEDASLPEVDIVFGGEESDAGAARRSRGPRAKPRSDAAEGLRREVLERHGQLGSLDHYGVLGLAREAKAAEIKRAYLGAAKRYHPDALASLGLDDVRSQANALFARIAKAYATLSDPQRRREYDAELEGSVAADANRLANAESLYRKGEVLLRMGDFAGALQFLKPAVDLWPEDAAYQSAVGWALFKQTRPDPEAARKHLERAVSLQADEATSLFRLGVVLKALGDTAAGEKHIARARKLDPKVDGR